MYTVIVDSKYLHKDTLDVDFTICTAVYTFDTVGNWTCHLNFKVKKDFIKQWHLQINKVFKDVSY